MKVALAQVRLDWISPSRNIRQLLWEVRRAVREQEEIDIIVLPGCCNTGGRIVDGPFSPAHQSSVSAVISSLAYEWGVYIVAGLQGMDKAQKHCEVCVWDPNGDLMVRHRGSSDGKVQRSDVNVPRNEEVISRVGTPKGIIVLGTLEQMDGAGGVADFLRSQPRGCFLVVPNGCPYPCESEPIASKAWAELREHPIDQGPDYLAVVSSPMAPSDRPTVGPVTFLWNSRQGVTASIAPDTEDALYCDLRLS